MSRSSDESISAPQPLSEGHDIRDFECGEPSLDDWLRQRARANQASGASRTFVTCSGGERVIGYYCLSACGISHRAATSSIRRNMPDPIPMLLVGRLAIDRRWQGRQLGSGLLKDAVLRSAQIAGQAGVRGLMVHAISEEAKRFYMRWNFVESPADRMTLMVRLADIVSTIKAAS